MSTWFTADLHLSHTNIIVYSGRPFYDADSMNEAIIESWNDMVAPDDTVWVLGDIAFGKQDQSLPLVGLLHGNKILVPGNHDRCFVGHRRLHKGDPEAHAIRLNRARQPYLDAGFAQIFDSPEPVDIAGHCVLLSHFPYVGDSRAEHDRYDAWRPINRGGWLVHGHVHEKWRQTGRQINVGLDAWGGRPVKIDEVANLINAGPGNLDRQIWEHNGVVRKPGAPGHATTT